MPSLLERQTVKSYNNKYCRSPKRKIITIGAVHMMKLERDTDKT